MWQPLAWDARAEAACVESAAMSEPGPFLARVDDDAAFQQLLDEVRQHGGLVVEVPSGAQPAQFSTVAVAVVSPAGEIARVSAQLVQVLGPGQAAVMLDGAQRDALLAARFGSDASAALEDALAEDDELEALEEDEPEGGAPPRDLPLWAKWEELSKPDKIKLARYGNADARRMVLKDRDPMLHRMVLNNPGLTPNELVALLKGGAASSALVRAVTERSELVGNLSVADALVANPHTPLDIAVRLVAKIPLESAKRIAKAGNLRAGVVGAARKRVLR